MAGGPPSLRRTPPGRLSLHSPNNPKLHSPPVGRGAEVFPSIAHPSPPSSSLAQPQSPRSAKEAQGLSPSGDAGCCQARSLPLRRPAPGPPRDPPPRARSVPRGLCPEAALLRPVRGPLAFPARAPATGSAPPVPTRSTGEPRPASPGTGSRRYLQGPPRLSAPRRRHLAFQSGCTFQGVNSDL